GGRGGGGDGERLGEQGRGGQGGGGGSRSGGSSRDDSDSSGDDDHGGPGADRGVPGVDGGGPGGRGGGGGGDVSGGYMKVCAPGTEQTGRWTKDEHDLFLRALKKYGKEWKRVASMVRTRTVVQTRTHAQKYFQKLQKAAAVGVNVGGIGGGGMETEDGTVDLMDIEVHMNTIDP
ncbi:unnamed protein product, partial [Discosporangium mesarthrocarpum]